jgi:ribosomal protein L11 methyltransferase
MNRRLVWKIAVTTNREGEEAVCELLESRLGVNPAAYANARTGKTVVAVYCDSKPAPALGKILKQELKRIRDCGLRIGSAKVLISTIKREDWAESWKRHFKPMEIGDALLIKPSWSRRKPKPGQSTMVLDPGLSFGTGHHATTSFCLEQLVRWRRAGETQSVLDIGTGSGILAIAAARLGYLPVHAFDFDPEAVKVANRNAQVNKVASLVRIKRQDLGRLPLRPVRQYDVICANLISTLLVAERIRIVNLLKPAGRLVIAGILKSEFVSVERAFNLLGLRTIKSKAKKEWRSGVLCRVGS